MMNYDDLITLGIAFGLGLLVGLQREKTNSQMAGVRTFTLVAILGALAGILTRDLENHYIIPAFALTLTLIMAISNYIKIRRDPQTYPGITTEISLLLIFVIGVYLVGGNKLLGVIVGATVVILLFLKESLHGFIDKLKDKELNAIMTFVGISLIILPILPDRDFGPFDVFNPREIWLMVTLIVGLSLLGYFMYKITGKKAGIISNGIIGGMISSTATTVTYARQTASQASFARIAAFIILSADTVSIIRVIAEVGIVVPQKLPEVILPFMTLFVFMAILAGVIFYLASKDNQVQNIPEPENPAQFKSALIFGLMYGIILFAVTFAQEKLGDQGLYIVSAVGGLVKKDAITLSLAQSMRNGMATDLGWRLIMTGVLANMGFKLVLVGILGHKKLLKWMSVLLGVSVIFGVLLILLWPSAQ